MNRRQLLKLLALGVIGHELDIDRLLWVPNERTIFLPTTDWKPHPKQLEFFNSDVPISLYSGIPYHSCVHATGEWLGFKRNTEAVKELIKLVAKLEDGSN